MNIQHIIFTIFVLKAHCKFNRLGRILKALRIGGGSISKPKTLKGISKLQKHKPLHHKKVISRKIVPKKPKGSNIDIATLASGASLLSDSITIGTAVTDYFQEDTGDTKNSEGSIQEDEPNKQHSDRRSTKTTHQSNLRDASEEMVLNDEPRRQLGNRIFTRTSLNSESDSHEDTLNDQGRKRLDSKIFARVLFNPESEDDLQATTLNDEPQDDFDWNELEANYPFLELLTTNGEPLQIQEDKAVNSSFDMFSFLEELSSNNSGENTNPSNFENEEEQEKLKMYEALKAVNYDPVKRGMNLHVQNLLFLTDEESMEAYKDSIAQEQFVADDQAQILVKYVSNAYVNLISLIDKYIHDQFVLTQETLKKLDIDYQVFVNQKILECLMYIDEISINFLSTFKDKGAEDFLRELKTQVKSIITEKSEKTNIQMKSFEILNQIDFDITRLEIKEDTASLKIIEKVKSKIIIIMESLKQKYTELHENNIKLLKEKTEELFQNHIPAIKRELRILSEISIDFLVNNQ